MTELQQLMTAIKRELRARGLSYKDVAGALELSEASVKRVFSAGTFTLARLAAIAGLLDMTMFELMSLAATTEPRLRGLTTAQESEIVADERMLLVAACVLSHWTVANIVNAYQISEAQCIACLLKLDRVRLIDLLPGNRVRLNVARDFEWLPDGPIRRYFQTQGENDFLASPFGEPDEMHFFVHGMLSAGANEEMRAQMRRLRRQFSALHEEGLKSPIAERSGTGLLVAFREWEPLGFAELRRVAQKPG